MLIRRLSSDSDFADRAALLLARNLKTPCRANGLHWGAFFQNDMVGTLSAFGSTLMGLAVSKEAENAGIATRLIQTAVTELLVSGQTNVRVFTKSAEAPKLVSLGFNLVEKTDAVALLEWNDDFSRYAAQLNKTLGELKESASAVVINANPFTLGHRFLIEKALETSDEVCVFVVSEDVSFFPFLNRFRYVQLGLADLEKTQKVKILPSGPYMVSLASFPSYFIRSSDKEKVHAELDIKLFAKLAKRLGIHKRFFGSEPFSKTTAVYNDLMKRDLPRMGVTAVEIPRMKVGEREVSASYVRDLVASRSVEQVREFVPASVFNEIRNYVQGLKNHES